MRHVCVMFAVYLLFGCVYDQSSTANTAVHLINLVKKTYIKKLSKKPRRKGVKIVILPTPSNKESYSTSKGKTIKCFKISHQNS